MEHIVLHSAKSLHGRLQRGRGCAARAAAGVPGAGEFVHDCVRRDPRWDGQCEDRALYYARLIVDLELRTAPITDHLFDPADTLDTDHWRTSLAIDVLGELVRLSRREAAEPLRRYVAEGTNWRDALDVLVDLDDLPLVADLDTVALARCDEQDLAWLAGTDRAVVGVWAERNPRLAELRRPAPRVKCARPDLGGRSEADLAELARERSESSRGAILELGRRRSPVVLDLAEELLPLRPHHLGGPLCRALRDLGPAALPRARMWATSEISDIGVDVLATHGTDEDVPLLMAALMEVLDDGNWGAAVTPVAGLGRLKARPALPALLHVWDESAYAALRRRTLHALREIAPEVSEPYLIEALWDCESGSRLLAAEYVPLNRDTRPRLKRLRHEAAEDPDVRAAADERLVTR